MLPLATVIGRILEICGIPPLTAALWSGFYSAWMWLRDRDDEIEKAAKAAAPPGFIVGCFLALTYLVYLLV